MGILSNHIDEMVKRVGVHVRSGNSGTKTNGLKEKTNNFYLMIKDWLFIVKANLRSVNVRIMWRKVGAVDRHQHRTNTSVSEGADSTKLFE